MPPSLAFGFWFIRLQISGAKTGHRSNPWADLARLPQPERLVVERSWAGPPSLSNQVEVILEVRNQGRVYVECRLLDDVPTSLIAEPPLVAINAGGHSSASASYFVRPLERGDVTLGAVWLRYQGGSQFAERWAQAGLKQTIRVFPDLEEAKRTIFISPAPARSNWKNA